MDKIIRFEAVLKPDDFNAKNKTEMNNSPFLVHFDNRDAIRQLIKKKHVASLYKVRKKSLCNVTSAERA